MAAVPALAMTLVVLKVVSPPLVSVAAATAMLYGIVAAPRVLKLVSFV
jgi:hypothetical protein